MTRQNPARAELWLPFGADDSNNSARAGSGSVPHQARVAGQSGAPPVACDLSAAPDTPQERLAAYDRLFRDALIGRERTPEGIRFRFRDQSGDAGDTGVEARVRHLAALEMACCPFFAFVVSAREGEVWWDAAAPPDPMAQSALDALFDLPDTAAQGVAAVEEQFARTGFRVITADRRGLRTDG